MACSADRNTATRMRGQTICNIPVYTGVTIYAGSIVALRSDGYAVPGADTSGYKVIGVAEEQVVNAGASGSKKIRVRTGVNKFTNSSSLPVVTATLATASGFCYVEDDCTVARSSNNSICAGIVTEIDADGGVWVDVSNYSPYAAVIAQQGAYTQTYSTADKTHAARTAAALTDNSTGSAGTTIAAGVGVSHLTFPITLASIADGDLITAFTPGYKFKILGFYYVPSVIATTGGKASTLNIEIGTTNLTGGSLALTTAACGTLGVVTAASAITAANTGTAADTISIEAATTTTFIEGSGCLVIKIQNMDTADAVASLAAQCNAGRVDSLDTAGVVNALVDDLQAVSIVG